MTTRVSERPSRESAAPAEIAAPGQYKPLGWLAKLVTAGFALYAAGLVTSFIIRLQALDLGAPTLAGEYTSAETIQTFDAKLTCANLAVFGCLYLCVVLWTVWTYRVAQNARALGAQRMTISPRWAVAFAFFYVPFLNLWRPYAALKEIWAASATRVGPAHLSSSRAPVPLFFPAWWAAWLGSGVLSCVVFLQLTNAARLPKSALRLAGGAVERRRSDVGVEELLSAHPFDLYLLVASGIAAALALTVMWALTRRQEAAAHGGVPRARAQRAR
jgi:hypothetical protein